MSKYSCFRVEKSSDNRHDDSNATTSPENGLVDAADMPDNVIVDGCGRKFVFSVAVIDWDPKPFERISKYYYEDGEIVKNYLRHANTGEQAKCDLGLDSWPSSGSHLVGLVKVDWIRRRWNLCWMNGRGICLGIFRKYLLHYVYFDAASSNIFLKLSLKWYVTANYQSFIMSKLYINITVWCKQISVNKFHIGPLYYEVLQLWMFCKVLWNTIEDGVV